MRIRYGLPLFVLSLNGACGDGETASDASETGTGLESSDSESATASESTGDGDGTTTGDGDGTTTGDGDGTTTGDGDGTTTGDGDGTTTGDGDGTTAGDGDGTTSGDGDGTTGDGDGDGATGDGDGATGDGDGATGDGDGATGDGDGDGATGDGDGTSGDGDGTTGDGDGTSGDGDGTTGDGDGTTGDGDGTSGDGDGTSGDGDGTSGDGDGTTGDGDGTSGDGDGTTGDGTTGDGDGTSCFEQDFNVNPIPPNVMFVLDKSGSMTDAFGSGNRWDALVAVVDDLLVAFQTRIAFGNKLFPRIGAGITIMAGACEVDPGVEVGCALNNRIPIANSFPTSNEVKGGTPATFAVTEAVTYLQTLDPLAPRAMILVSDGDPNCNPDSGFDDTLDDTVAAACAAGIPTYVVGIGIQPPPNMMAFDSVAAWNTVANAGCVPKNDPTEQFYNTQDAQALNDALALIAADTLTCILPLSVPPPNPDNVRVTVDGVVYLEVTDCTTETGWVYGPGNAYIEVCGTACDQLKATNLGVVEYFCTSG